MMPVNFNVYDKLNEPIEEAFEILRTNLLFHSFDKTIKSITVTSFSPGEGKTTTSINLAISFARAGLKVLLIDADMRKPMIMKHIASNALKGLSNLIASNEDTDKVIGVTSIENLYFIPCGPKPPNPSALIGSQKFSKILKSLIECFDIVIVDTPPLGSVIDSAIIAAQTDGTILVLGSNAIQYRNVNRVKEQLEKVNARILGVILNKVDKKEYKNYYNHYDYYPDKLKNSRNWFKNLKRSRMANL